MRATTRAKEGRRKAPFFLAGPAAAMLIAALVPAPQARADQPVVRPGVVGADDRVMLDPTAWPWTALGRLNREGGGFCTGALVAADVVLTAEHCLYHRVSGRLLAPHRIHFLAALRRDTWRAHARGQRYIRPSRATDLRAAVGNGGIADDWALIVLDRPIDGRPLPVRRLRSGDGPGRRGEAARVLVAGYGFDRPYLLSLHRYCTAQRDETRDGVLRHTCDAVPGASGSPLLTTDANGHAVVGVISGFTGSGDRARGFAVDTAAILRAMSSLAADRTADQVK